MELIANSYDAGADLVEITWPSDKGDVLRIEDNGTGMTHEEFERRWRTLTYKRTNEQGPMAEWPPGAKKKHPRVAFGQNGRGRHGAFCFADTYRVETWKGGERTIAQVELTSGGAYPFDVKDEQRDTFDGHGTAIETIASRKILPIEELRAAIGRIADGEPGQNGRMNFPYQEPGRYMVVTTYRRPDPQQPKHWLVDTSTLTFEIK